MHSEFCSSGAVVEADLRTPKEYQVSSLVQTAHGHLHGERHGGRFEFKLLNFFNFSSILLRSFAHDS